MRYAVEPLAGVVEALPALCRAHYVELYGSDDGFALNGTVLDMLDEAGALVIATARQDGALVGYCAFVLSPDLRRAGRLVAVDAGIYLDPAHRRGTAAVLLIRVAEAAATERGAVALTVHMPMENPRGALMTRLGYRVSETVYLKEL